jgi:cytochrome P450
MPMARHAELPARSAEFWDPRTPPGYDSAQTFNVFSYREVRRVLTDEEAFSADYGITDQDAPNVHPEDLGLWMAGGLRHGHLRALVEDPFRRQQLEPLGPRVAALAHELLDAAIGRGDRIDVVVDFARPLHLRTTCLLLGLDPVHVPLFDRWILRSAASTAVNAIAPEPEESAFWLRLIAERRAHPQHGLVDQLIAAQQDGYVVGDRLMTDWDLVGYLAMFIASGYETAAAIANAALFFLEFGLFDQLRSDPALLAAAVEETLRWYSPFSNARRQALADTELAGQTVKAGTWVVAWLIAANRDPGRFPDPDPNRFAPGRAPNPHLAFGYGRRHCLGAALARLELTTALGVLLERLPGLRVDPSEPLTRTYGIVDALDGLVCTFEPPAHR